jgi:hypothetical protein
VDLAERILGDTGQQEAIGPAGSHVQRDRGAAGHIDRRARLLIGLGPAPGLAQGKVAALEASLVLCPQRVEHLRELARPLMPAGVVEM